MVDKNKENVRYVNNEKFYEKTKSYDLEQKQLYNYIAQQQQANNCLSLYST